MKKIRHINRDTIMQMRGGMFKQGQFGEDWKCGSCGDEFKKETVGNDLGMIITQVGNKRDNFIVCMDCIKHFEGLGVENLEYKLNVKHRLKKEHLEILGKMEEGVRWHEVDNVDAMDIKELEDILAEKERIQNEISNINPDEWNELEDYIYNQYSVVEDKAHLLHVSQIEDYFTDNSYDDFECGQGYHQDEIERIAHINNKFYEVRIFADIGSQKQNRGDRLYWVERITGVTYREIDKPIKKDVYVPVSIHEDDISRAIETLEDAGIRIGRGTGN